MQDEQSFYGALQILREAFGTDPLRAIQRIERELPGLDPELSELQAYIENSRFTAKTLDAALEIKQAVGQINVLVHAVGIMISLPHILEPGEQVLSVSLGAGNTGKDFDLETNLRVAEFKFIAWRGGSETIRQNQVFKDFLKLLWDTSGRRKQLFLSGTEEALRFLRGGRALNSILSRNVTLKAQFSSIYGGRFMRIGEFYSEVEREVEVRDLRMLVPAFAQTELPPEEPILDEM